MNYCDYCMHTGAAFPTSLNAYGLNEKLLQVVFNQVLEGREPEWHLKGIPENQFYRELHQFLKKWPVSYRSTKKTIATFYCAIDPNLKARGIRVDNVYRLIERTSQGKQSPYGVMSYGNAYCESVIKAMCSETNACTEQVEALTLECTQLRKKLEESQKQLSCTRKALQDVTNQKFKFQKQCSVAKTKATKLKHDYAVLEDSFAQLEEDNIELSSAISDLHSELESIPDESVCECNIDEDFSFPTKNGRRYSPAIRKLYYTLLSKQIPSVKIADMIKTVIRSFFPAIDVDKLKLPQRSCADYMRRCELTTISNAHKATVLCESASESTCKGFRLNTDGPQNSRKKLEE